MLRNYLLLAGRSLIKNKLFSLINILGLSVGITICILILQFVRFELSYDNFHQNADNIYRVATKVTLQNEVINNLTNTYEGIAKALKEEFPEIKATTSISGFDSDNTFIRFEDEHQKLKPLQSFKGYNVDSSFFSVFSFPLVGGNRHTIWESTNSAVVSEAMAFKYFGGNPIGKILETNNGEEVRRYKITGVIKDVPANSHFKFDILIHSPATDKSGFWEWCGQTYVLLQDHGDITTLEQKLNKLALAKNGLKVNKDDYGQTSTFHLQPLRDIHLYSRLLYELEGNGSSSLVYALMVLAFVIIIVAWVNYVNLATAISAEKIKAIGIRKIVGASRLGLIFQVLIESALFNVLSILIAALLAVLIMPSFANFTGIPLDFTNLFNKWVCVSIVCFL